MPGMTGRRASDWLAFTPKRESDERGPNSGSCRRDADRRATDRRGPRRKVDPLFCATLLNQIHPADDIVPTLPYRADPAPIRPGILTNLRA
ncbi:MAG: hypothetical protein JNJ73_16100 [Hyphomonadaceae bacterium]|nr:hypothetical protein [Hyphomonadaceae bacterium]